ncbi:unnamed protein product [Medioppia subpectinata]|uniref:Glu-AdT subunit C n=1 Tax=Medioppia subpectinata TaxID=1979941 RepID=A0A7R9L498_9ACAR|nr:unnamed protein product [Medioppia subpectinata]CAG2114095.1 unnamed protein product [Medioppia subpectinata]
MSSKDILKVVPLLERLSLIRFGNESGVKRLREAIDFADQLKDINVDGVEPMISPNETKCTFLRQDTATHTDKQDITQNAKFLVEGYFVAPNQ